MTFCDISFPEKKSLFLDEYNLIDKLNHRRANRYFYDKNLIIKDPFCFELSDFTCNIPEGRCSIHIGNARFECFFKKGTQKKLFIVLGGSRLLGGGRKREIPKFNRWSWYSNVNAYWLSIEDPMYYLDNNLLTGWFYGTKTENFRLYLVRIAKYFANRFGIETDKIVFYGSSAGGTAALHAASLLGGGAVGVSINGQYNFDYSRKDIDNFESIMGIKLNAFDPFQRTNIENWIQNKQAKFIIIGNVRSDWDRQDHLKFLERKINAKFKIGINGIDNLVVWLYEANGFITNPHSCFEDRNLFYLIDLLIEKLHSDNNSSQLEGYQDFFLLMNEFWFEKYEQEKKLITTNKLIKRNSITSSKFVKIGGRERDRYAKYKLNEPIKSNVDYCLFLDIDIIKTSTKNFTVAIFDWRSRSFLLKEEFDVASELCICFRINSPRARPQLFLYPGRHGSCNGQTLYINKMQLY